MIDYRVISLHHDLKYIQKYDKRSNLWIDFYDFRTTFAVTI